MEIPRVKNYLDVNQFLEDFYQYKKQVDASFSYQTWAEQLQIKSKSYLRFAILGKRKISDVLLKKLVSWFHLDSSDEEYFIILTQYTQTTEKESKNIFSKKLMELIKLDSLIHSVAETTPTIADPLLFHLRDLASCEDIQRTPDFFAKYLNVPFEKVIQRLAVLVENNLVLKKDGQWISTHQSIKIADSPNHTNLNDYHRKSLTTAIEMLQNQNILKKYRSLNFFLTEDEFTQMNQRMYDFLTILFNEYSQSSSAQGKKIYQLNYNMSPRSLEISS